MRSSNSDSLDSKKQDLSKKAEDVQRKGEEAGQKGKGVAGKMLDPSIFNNQLVRLVTIAATVAALSYGSKEAQGNVYIGLVHLISFALWFGISVWTTFFAGLIMIKSMPRQVFGRVQHKLFPWYFSLNTVSVGVIALTTFLSGVEFQRTLATIFSAGILSNLANLLYVEPQTSAVMFQRYALEDEPGVFRDEDKIADLRKSFGKWHGISSFTNLINVASAFAYAVILARRAVYFIK